MIRAIIEISRALAIIKFFYHKLFGVSPEQLQKMREEIREAYKNAKEQKDIKHIARLINNRK